MAMVNTYTKRVIVTKVNGKITWQRAKEWNTIRTEVFTKGTGNKI